MTPRRGPLVIGGVRVRPGETRNVRLKISETFTGQAVEIPVRVFRAKRAGPRVFVLAAIHGDEVNGTGIVRELTWGEPPALVAGTLVCVPVVNLFGFEAHDRYLPDRRDLNRSFPGAASGSLASRMAKTIMDEIVRRCDYGIDLHSAATRRTNFPNVRADLGDPETKRIATAFGCELVVHGKGPEGSLRRAAIEAGVPTIILEAGEVAKIEPGVLELGVRGVRNVLIELGLLRGERVPPPYQATVRKSMWVRAELGGLLRFHVSPGDLVEGGQPLATTESLFGDARSVLIAPCDGIVLGMVTHPAVRPGEPICHLAVPGKSLRSIRRALQRASGEALAHQVRENLAAGITVSDEHGRPEGRYE